MRKILFITGTRADYGKIKSLIKAVEDCEKYEAHVFVSGMHLIEKYGATYNEILKDGYKNVYVDFTQANKGSMSYDLGNIICNLTGYVEHVRPDMIVVHGDRIDALAGAIVGALNNVIVAHVEGGEVSGTIDESTRHAITKFAHLHLVCNEDAKNRLIQLGEEKDRIHVIGSPDVDVMLSDKLPSLESVRQRYDITYEKYAIAMYHPVTTDRKNMRKKARQFVDAMVESKDNYVVIYPNNDLGTDIILQEYERLEDNNYFRLFPSLRFEYFLTLLKNADYMIGNSSAGVRETGVYGVPAIDLGSRQTGRYSKNSNNIQHVNEEKNEILTAISQIDDFRKISSEYGSGDSTAMFMSIINNEETWKFDIQKRFIDLNYWN